MTVRDWQGRHNGGYMKPDWQLVDEVYREMEMDDAGFTPWEVDFVVGLYHSVEIGDVLSDNQRDVLERLYEEKC